MNNVKNVCGALKEELNQKSGKGVLKKQIKFFNQITKENLNKVSIKDTEIKKSSWIKNGRK